MATNIEKRRKIRALEAQRDKLLTNQQLNKQKLAVVRTQLKEERRK